MNSRWQASKIGLVNFWYYDEQEFSFSKGRMLLRGSNGSGKSVTMQSVVPLLLDGNMSPERLDPFGTKDRKMSNYLLEDDDEKEERTGYLYLEFRRKESDTYITIGMGMRARRGKPLDKWYFSLSDGRRIGKDFFLYKEMGERIPLSKKELENRILPGGRVFDRQAEYMEYVNHQIFGFDTVDEYKEMVDLLIQLRTPKLSKDFKPSVISEILSDSLQPLSDEDLRPMSEAIENMDTMNMNLKARVAASQAAEKISKVFGKYNQLLLFEKAVALRKVQDKLVECKKDEDTTIQQKEECAGRIKELQDEYESIEAKRESMEKERDSLNKSDAVGLKKRENELEKEIEEGQDIIKKKQELLDNKKSQERDIKNRQDEAENQKYIREKDVKDMLEQMESEAEDMSFEEHAFFKDELLQRLEENYSFDTHEKQFNDVREKIGDGLHILEESDYLDRQADTLMKEREECIEILNGKQKRQSELESQFVQIQNEWKEKLYHWNGENKELILERDCLNDLSHFADSYNAQSDFSSVRKTVGDFWIENDLKLKTAVNENRREAADKQKEYDLVKDELAQWEGEKEPTPERSEEVIRNRERLDKLGIPYQEFYKVIEFGKELDEETCNHLEEALLKMGILDAIVVDEDYKEQVLQMEKGCEDNYLFMCKTKAERSLLDVLELNDEVNDIFSNQRLTSILSSIEYGDNGMISVSPEGHYQMGVLAGTITGEHTAEYIGTKAREKSRQMRIAACKEKLEALEKELKQLDDDYKILGERINKLKEEYELLPDDTDLREAFQMLTEVEKECEALNAKKLEKEELIKELKEEIREKKEQAYEIAKVLYLDCTYPVFKTAYNAAEQYNNLLVKLQSAHWMYLNVVQSIKSLAEQMENIIDDMDQIIYDIETADRKLRKNQAEYDSIKEQLKLTDYDEIKERLDYCISWLGDYHNKLEKCVKERTENQERYAQYEKHLEVCRRQLEEFQSQEKYHEKCFAEELQLEYIELPEEMENTAKNVSEYLETDVKALSKNDVIQNLNQVYFENRGFLNDYQLMQTELFQELDEEKSDGNMSAKRIDITARYQGIKIPFTKLLSHLQKDIEELQDLIKAGDRELFEDILANTVSRKIRGKINASNAWVAKMNKLMESMNTSSGLRLSLRWRSKTAESEQQLDTKELVELLKKDYRLMSEEEASKLSMHFRSKVEEARRHTKDSGGMISFYQVMKDTLDYRKWFEFQLFSQKTGERQKELTNSVFGTFSGGEKAMSMYVPLFSAVVAKYQGGRQDAPRLISLDEAFAGVDNRNIRDMFRLMTEFEFDFIINSQVLWGDCDTLDALAIYQLQRPKNAKFVTVMPYLWNGHTKEMLESEEMVEQRSAELE